MSNEIYNNSLLEENSAILDTIAQILEAYDAKDLKKSDFSRKLKDVGINSISFVKIVIAVEAEYDIEFEDDKLILDGFENLEAFIVYIIEKIKELEGF